MAAGLFKKALPEIAVSSAGLGALIGRPADPIAVELMAEQGVDISDHIARQLTPSLCRQSDLILVMDQGQILGVERTWSASRGKVFRLCASPKIDVPDPYRLGKDEFISSLSLMEKGVDFWVQRINKISKQERQFS